MDTKLIQQALNAAIALDIRHAEKELNLSLAEHVKEFSKLSPNIAKALVAIGKLNTDKMQAEAN
jgi:hypothetical protein